MLNQPLSGHSRVQGLLLLKGQLLLYENFFRKINIFSKQPPSFPMSFRLLGKQRGKSCPELQYSLGGQVLQACEVTWVATGGKGAEYGLNKALCSALPVLSTAPVLVLAWKPQFSRECSEGSCSSAFTARTICARLPQMSHSLRTSPAALFLHLPC